MVSKCIGIISYLPDNNDDRRSRLTRTFELCNNLFKNIDIIVIAQNWHNYTPPTIGNKITIYKYKNKLGITGARRKLREVFLASDYDYLIMLDDDAYIEGSDASTYLSEIDNNKNNAGIYRDGKLTLFAISKFMYNIIDIPKNLAAENGDFFEDVYITEICKKYYSSRTFRFSQDKLNELTWEQGHSTWWNGKYNASEIADKTHRLIDSYVPVNIE